MTISAGSNLEIIASKEKQMVDKAQRMLDRLVGPGNGTVSISLDLDFTRRSQNTTRVFAPIELESTTISRESATPIPNRGGIAGTESNVENADDANNEPLIATETIEEQTTKMRHQKRIPRLKNRLVASSG